MSARKLWATSYSGTSSLAVKQRHDSKAAAYRFVAFQRLQFQAGVLRSSTLSVWVDERGGRGWQLYERVDLAAGGAS